MFDDHYVNWQKSRIDTIEKYLGFEFFKNKSLSEIGCGYAFFGNFFNKFCDKVSVSDARNEHIEIVKREYPDLKSSVMDVDGIFTEEKTDILIDFGVLYHIKDVESHIKSFVNYDYIILETEVVDSLEKENIHVNENGYDQAFNGIGSRPSQSVIENLLDLNGFDYIMIKDKITNSGMHIYDWDISDSKSYRDGLRRFWICWNKNLHNPCRV